MYNFLDYWNQKARGGVSRLSQVGMPDLDQVGIKSIVDEMLYYVALDMDSPILEIGCGNGLLLQEFQSIGFSNLSGCDYSIEMIKKAEEYCRNINFKVIGANEIDQAYNGKKFSFIYMHSVTQYFEDQLYFEDVLRKCVDLLDQGGSIFIGDIINENVAEYLESKASRSIRSRISKILGKNKSKPGLKSFYPNINTNILGSKGYDSMQLFPLIEWKNSKPLMFKALRFNLLIK